MMEPTLENNTSGLEPNGSSHWTENQEVMVKNFPLRVAQRIGEGLTATIYRGVYRERDVVVKVMKVDTGVDIRSYFISEGKFINSIRTAWDDLWPGEAQVVPEIFADESSLDEPYLVMELIKGQDFEHLVENAILSEPDVLSLGVQIGKLLVTLHEGLKKSYADIKFDNFWMLDERNVNGKPCLKVIDWNILSDTDPFKIRRDLFFATVYLFRILTGATLQSRGIQLRTRVQQIEALGNLSVGMQRFFLRSLHPDLSHRFNSARQWSQQVNELLGWWEKEPADLNMAAGRELDAANLAQNEGRQAEALDAFNRARDILDISDRKGRGSRVIWQNFFTRIKAGLESTSDLETGINFLKTWQFEEARARFKRGADLSMAEPERLLRWYWLATSGLEMGRENFRSFETNEDGSNDLITGVQALLDGNPLKAEEVLGKAAERLSPIPPSLAALQNEARILNLASRAQGEQARGEYQLAADTYEKAYRLWADLPETPKTTWAETLGNVFQLWEDARHDANTLGVARAELAIAQDAISRGSLDLAAVAFENALKAADDFPETIKAWQLEGSKCLQNGNIEDVLVLLRPALGFFSAKEAILPLWQAGQQINKILGLARAKKIDEATEVIELYCSAHTGDRVALGNAFQQAVSQTASVVMAEAKMDLFDRITAAASQYTLAIYDYLDQLRNEYQGRLIKQRQTRVEEIWQEVFALHEKKNRADSKKAQERLSDLRHLMTDEEWAQSHWQELVKCVRERGEGLEMEHQQLESQMNQRLHDIQMKLTGINDSLDRDWNLISQLDLSNTRHRNFYEEIILSRFYLVRDALVLLREWQQIIPSAEEPERLAVEYRSKLDIPAIDAVSELYDSLGQRLEIAKNTLSQARADYESGQLPECYGELDAFESSFGSTNESTNLRTCANKVGEFMSWIATFVQELPKRTIEHVHSDPQLHEWLGQKLPAVYWKNAGDQLLNWAQAGIQQGVNELLRLNKDDSNRITTGLANLIMYHRLEMNLRAAQGTPITAGNQDLQSLVEIAYHSIGISDSRKQRAQSTLLHALDQILVNTEVGRGTIRNHLETIKKREQRRKLLLGFGIAIPVLVLLGYLAYRLLLPIISDPTPTETPVVSTPVPPTEVPPTPIPPTPVPTTAVPPTPVPPTPFPVSVNVYPPFEVNVAVPVGIIPAYLLDDANSIRSGPEGYWQQYTESGTKAVGGGIWASLKSTTEEASIMLRMDQPLAEAGLYEIFVSDTVNYTRTVNKPYRYDVGLVNSDGMFSPLQPVRGSNQVTLKGNPAQATAGTEWVSIGMYQFNLGDTIAVRFNATGQIEDSGGGGMDAILIGRLPDLPAEEVVPMIRQIPGEIVFWADDAEAKLEPFENWGRSGANAGNWLGETVTDYPSVSGRPVQMSYTFHRLDVGKYELYAWISPMLEGKVDYQILLDDKPVESVPVLTIDSADGRKGTLVRLGEVTIADAALPNLLKVILKPNVSSEKGKLAGDVILVVRAPQQ